MPFCHVAVMMKQAMASLETQQNKLHLLSEVTSRICTPPKRGVEEEQEDHGLLKFTRGIPTAKKLISVGTGGSLKSDTRCPKPATLSGNELVPPLKLLPGNTR